MVESQRKIRISPRAQTKVILHCTSNPYTQVHGILLGGAPSTSRLDVVDAIPICHSSPTKPMLDMSFRIASEYLSSDDAGKSIVGWYTANERLEDKRPNQASLRIMGTIGAFSATLKGGGKSDIDPVLLVVNNAGLETLLANEDDNDGGTIPLFQAFGKGDAKNSSKNYNSPVDSSRLETEDEGVVASIAQDLGKEAKVPIYDFEDHVSGGAAGVKETDWLCNDKVCSVVEKYSKNA